MGVVTALEVPVELLTVAEAEAMVCSRVMPVGGVPEKVNGTEIVNRPPKAWEAELSNHAGAAWLRFTGTWEFGRLNPVAAVNCTFSVVRLRVVE
jgi:hypothetical protein